MKTIKTILLASALIFSSAIYSQNNIETLKETTLKNYQIEHNGGTTEYTLKIESSKHSPVTMYHSEKYEREQERRETSDLIRKEISIDTNSDGKFDRILSMSYESRADDSFEIKPTNTGFTISIIGKNIYYDLFKNEYSVKKEYSDLFEIMLNEVK